MCETYIENCDKYIKEYTERIKNKPWMADYYQKAIKDLEQQKADHEIEMIETEKRRAAIKIINDALLAKD